MGNIIKLCNIYYNIIKSAGKYHALDVELEIKNNKKPQYSEFLAKLYNLYKAHDDLYNVLFNITANKQDDKFLDIVENITEDLPIIVNMSKDINNTPKEIGDDSIDILNSAKRLYDMYFGLFPIETRKKSLEEFSYLASMDLQYNLHSLLDKLFDQVIILL